MIIKQQQNILEMNPKQQEDDTLLQFLKKKSLFSKSPQTRSRSKSRISKDSELQLHHVLTQKHLHESHVPLLRNNLKQPKVQHSDSNMYYNTLETQISQHLIVDTKPDNKDKNVKFSTANQYNDSKLKTPPLSPSRNNLHPHTRSTLHPNSPQKPKLTSIQLIKQKIKAQLQKSSLKMRQYHHKLNSLLSIQIKKINKQLHLIFDRLYYQSQKYLKQYLKQKQILICQQVMHINNLLYQQNQKINILQSKMSLNRGVNVSMNMNNGGNKFSSSGSLSLRPQQQLLIYNIQKHIQDLAVRLDKINLPLPTINNIISLKLKDVQESIKYKFKT